MAVTLVCPTCKARWKIITSAEFEGDGDVQTPCPICKPGPAAEEVPMFRQDPLQRNKE